MKHDAFRYDFTLKELWFFLFKGKQCPKCGGRLCREKRFETAAGSDFNSRSADPFVGNARVKHYMYYYTCRDCGSEYSLKELCEMRR